MSRIQLIGFAAAIALSGAAAAQLSQTPEGVRMKDGGVAQGATLISSYEPYRPAGDTAKQDRAKNRAIVARFFQLPIGMERAALYGPEGVKQIPGMGAQWVGAEAQRKNNVQNQTLFPGWSWSKIVIWDTQDPTVFWVEAEGHTGPGQTPAFSNHYVNQFVVKNGKIVQFREFGTPLVLTK